MARHQETSSVVSDVLESAVLCTICRSSYTFNWSLLVGGVCTLIHLL